MDKSKYMHTIVVNLPHIHRVFSNLKTWLLGTHHGVSKQHLQAYLNEYIFRFNRRHTPMAAFQTILGLCSQQSGPTYKGLYGIAKGKNKWVHPGNYINDLLSESTR